jgi:predicted dienelactone hydrolase
MTSNPRALWFLLLFVTAFFPDVVHEAVPQRLAGLQAPTGSYPVGRTRFHWIDSKRSEVITDAPGDNRELRVHVWYPAANVQGSRSAYLPDAEQLAASSSAAALSNVFGPIWSSIRSRQLLSHAFENAPVASGPRFPLLIFSHGLGVTSIAYTAQMEDLASHGYIVAGIEHTYAAVAVAFPDGRVLPYANAFWSRVPGGDRTPEVEAFGKETTRIVADDIRFVLDKFIEANRDRNSLLRERIDTGRVAAFGHSSGGRAAAMACQLDRRLAACMGQDATWYWQPFWLDEKGKSMDQPYMMLDHHDPELPDEAFVAMNTTREAYASRRQGRREDGIARIYKTIKGGSYQVTLVTPGVAHMSFSDLRLLGRRDGTSGWPDDITAATPHEEILATVRQFTRAFFDKYLKRQPSTLLDQPGDRMPASVRIARYGRATP